MTTSSKISITIFILGLLVLSSYGFFFFRDRNSVPRVNKDTSSQQTSQQAPSNTTTNSSTESATDNSATGSSADSSDENTPDESNNFLDVSHTDCNNNCKNFTASEDLKYCQQICGLTPIKQDIKEKQGCDAFSDLEKDYCLKDLAISTKNVGICTEISDTDVKKICKSRIAQELIETDK
jgi:hypothetical protein